MLSDESWRILLQIGINKKQNDTSVEELSHKYTKSNRGDSLGLSVLTDPSDESDSGFLEDCIDDHDNKGNGCTNSDSIELIVEVVLTDWEFGELAILGTVVNSIRLGFLGLLISAEALQTFSEEWSLISLNLGVLLNKFFESILLPLRHTKTTSSEVLGLLHLAISFRVSGL